MAAGGSRSSRPRVPARLQAIAGGVLAASPVRAGRAVLDVYGSAGGGLLAAGLAYGALFALVPGILLILGIAGIVLGNGSAHDAFVQSVVNVVPPLEDLLGPAVDDLASTAGSTTIIGAIGLAWGASRFYNSFEAALTRVFGGVSRRGFVERSLLGLLSIAMLGAAFALIAVLAGVRSFIEAAAPDGVRPFAGLAGLLIDLSGPVATALAIGVLYRRVPPRRPAWRATLLPSVVVAAALTLVARLFVFLAPRLIGAAAVLGTVATVFAALGWLDLSFQAILLGAAWIDARDRAASESAMAPS